MFLMMQLMQPVRIVQKPKPLSELSSTADIDLFFGQTEMNKWRPLTIRLAAKSL